MFATRPSPGRAERDAQLRPAHRTSIMPRMDADRARELLARERARIEQALADLAAGESDDGVHPFDAAEGASDTFEAELDEGLTERLRDELEAVDRAQQRLAAGTYGLSVESGEPIPDARLQAIPWAERTAEEQARYDAGRA
jgi:DnaK suppressor protein